MGTADVAGAVRAQALARRRLGPAAARRLAARHDLPEAIDDLGTGPYGRYVRLGQTLEQVQTATLRSLLWHLRVLAGWHSGAAARRIGLLAGAFELANLDEHVRRPGLDATAEPFQLGALAVAWPRLEHAATLPEVRQVLAQSAWGDPGEETAWAVTTLPYLRWLQRIAIQIPAAGDWVAAAALLFVARERVVRDRPFHQLAAQVLARLVGSGCLEATSLAVLRARAERRGRWILDGVNAPDDLWRAEARWWGRLDRDGTALLHSARFSGDVAIGCAAVLATDAWRVRAALACAARGGLRPEVLDATV